MPKSDAHDAPVGKRGLFDGDDNTSTNKNTQSVVTPSKSKLFDMIQTSYSASDDRSNSDLWSTNSDPIFTAEDIFKVHQPTARMLRYILVAHNVTKKELIHKAVMYCRSIGYSESKINSVKTNLHKGVTSESITINKFDEIVQDFLGLRMLDQELTLCDNVTGKIYKHSIRDINDMSMSLQKENLALPEGGEE